MTRSEPDDDLPATSKVKEPEIESMGFCKKCDVDIPKQEGLCKVCEPPKLNQNKRQKGRAA